MNKTVKRLRDVCKAIAGAITEVVAFVDDLDHANERRASVSAYCLGSSRSLLPCVIHVRIRTRLLKSGMYVAQIRRADTNGWIWSSPYCTYDFTAVRHAQNKAAEMGWLIDAAPAFHHTPTATNTCSPVSWYHCR